jgi:DNA-binding IclR family transcriptional regulator
MTSNASDSTPNYPIGSVDSALQLLRIFSEQKTVRLADASREIGVARSTAHRMVQQLAFRGFVAQDPETRMYIAGPELVRMALSIVRQLDVRTAAVEVMKRLATQLGETTHIAELRGSDIFFLNSVEGPRSLRIGDRTGMTMPAYSTAQGKVLLAELDAEQLRAVLPAAKLKALTPSTHISRKALERELAEVRERGYATNFGESESDVYSVAVPIRDITSRARAALAIATPPTRLTEDMVPEIARQLQAGAEEIGAGLPV